VTKRPSLAPLDDADTRRDLVLATHAELGEALVHLDILAAEHARVFHEPALSDLSAARIEAAGRLGEQVTAELALVTPVRTSPKSSDDGASAAVSGR